MLAKINSIPKSVLVPIVLLVAVFLIVLNDPPKDACDAQLSLFFKSQVGKISSLKGTVGSLLSRTARYCGQVKTYGGCVEFHETLRGVIKDLRVTSPECTAKVISNEKIQMILKDSMTLMVKSAWGEKAPEPGPNVYGWMTMSEFSLFCSVKSLVYEHSDDEVWESLVRSIISQLPQSQDLKFNDGFERSLFSLRCESIYNF
jgi:hypothetical protein